MTEYSVFQGSTRLIALYFNSLKSKSIDLSSMFHNIDEYTVITNPFTDKYFLLATVIDNKIYEDLCILDSIEIDKEDIKLHMMFGSYPCYLDTIRISEYNKIWTLVDNSADIFEFLYTKRLELDNLPSKYTKREVDTNPLIKEKVVKLSELIGNIEDRDNMFLAYWDDNEKLELLQTGIRSICSKQGDDSVELLGLRFIEESAPELLPFEEYGKKWLIASI